MSGDAHVRFWESLGVQLPGATQPPGILKHSRLGHLSSVDVQASSRLYSAKNG
jgi:hypothetical protein